LVLVAASALAACGGDSNEADPQVPVDAIDDAIVNDLDGADPGAAVLDQYGIDTSQEDLADEIAGDFAASTGAGGATVRVGDMTFQAESEVCFSDPGFFQFDGLGRTAETTAWVSINATTNEDYDGDGIGDIDAWVVVEFGKSELLGPTEDGQADLQANVIKFSATEETLVEPMFEFSIEGSSVSGSGHIADSAGVVIPFGERAELSFTASC
jgi:hypothetical protein